MKTLKTVIPISEARQDLPELVDQVTRLNRRYFITRRGRAAAVLISADDFESWEETRDIIFNRAEMKAFKRALDDVKNGRVKTFKDVFGVDL